MNLTHNGKIGRLPAVIQQQLNRRLDQRERGRPLANWLNSLPEVQAILAAEFAGRPIREQNVSEWRKRGYQEWLRSREARVTAENVVAEIRELQPPGAPPLADQMAVWVTARYLLAVRKLAEKSAEGELQLKLLREFSQDIVAMRRADHSAARLKLEQERQNDGRLKNAEEFLLRSGVSAERRHLKNDGRHKHAEALLQHSNPGSEKAPCPT
jgi:hypothetical protein